MGLSVNVADCKWSKLIQFLKQSWLSYDYSISSDNTFLLIGGLILFIRGVCGFCNTCLVYILKVHTNVGLFEFYVCIHSQTPAMWKLFHTKLLHFKKLLQMIFFLYDTFKNDTIFSNFFLGFFWPFPLHSGRTGRKKLSVQSIIVPQVMFVSKQFWISSHLKKHLWKS